MAAVAPVRSLVFNMSAAASPQSSCEAIGNLRASNESNVARHPNSTKRANYAASSPRNNPSNVSPIRAIYQRSNGREFNHGSQRARRPTNFRAAIEPMSDNFCDAVGAGRLKRMIEDYWSQRGHAVTITFEAGAFSAQLRSARVDLRSDMLNGLPPKIACPS